MTSETKFSNFITNCIDLAFWRISMMFISSQFVINFLNLNNSWNSDVYILVSSLQLVRGQNWTVQTSEMKFWNVITNCVEFAFWRFSTIIFYSPQFVTNLSDLNYQSNFKVYVPVSSLQLIRELNDSLDIKVEVSELYYLLR